MSDGYKTEMTGNVFNLLFFEEQIIQPNEINGYHCLFRNKSGGFRVPLLFSRLKTGLESIKMH